MRKVEEVEELNTVDDLFFFVSTLILAVDDEVCEDLEIIDNITDQHMYQSFIKAFDSVV